MYCIQYVFYIVCIVYSMYCIQLYSNAWPFLTSMTSLDIHTPLRSSVLSPGTMIHDKLLPVPSPLYRQSHGESENQA